jgi:transcriptional regulator with XRE-family HTH domain
MSGKTIRDLFGENLKRLRIKTGLTQLALAGESNLAHTFINDLENGKKWISCQTLTLLCQVLHVEPNQFFLPVTQTEQENSNIFSTYVDEFSESVQKSVKEFKNRYV